MSPRWPWRRRPRQVVVYTREGCGLCRKAEQLVAEEAGRDDVTLVDVDGDEQLQRTYNLRVPVVEVDGEVVAEGLVTRERLRAGLRR